MAIERALVSVYDKSGVVEFARQLTALGVQLFSTGGTAKLLRDSGLRVQDVSELTGWPEMLGGRVKTLHPKVHGGILFRRGVTADRDEAARHGIASIDLVVVNLYPFEATAAEPALTPEELVENIDIGGPTMLRSAAKNFESVAAVCDPADYEAVAKELTESAGHELSLATRLRLARKVFATTSRYDGMITMEFERLAAETGGLVLVARPALPERVHTAFIREQQMRYGENPHQRAALYIPSGRHPVGLAGARQLQGKELSYNNLVDLDAAWKLVREFDRPAAAIIKHNNPCGVAEQSELRDAYVRAFECDPVSAFGGVVAFNRPLDGLTAQELAKLFVECVAAPGYDSAARSAMAAKKNVRLMEMPADEDNSPYEWKQISGGMLVQQPDVHCLRPEDLKTATKRAPTDAEVRAMLFAWKVSKHVKSNAIVFAAEGHTLGIGAGQMSRVDSVKLAVMKAQKPLEGSVVASDAFFPFPDGVEEAAKAGAMAVIQPGGSVRDSDVIAAADKARMAMVFTGIRHFRH